MSCNGKMTVGILPGTKESIVQPITLTGTPEEIDEGFFSNLAKPLQEAGLKIEGIDELSKQIDAIEKEKKNKVDAKKSNKAEKEKKPIEKKPAENKAGCVATPSLF